MSNDIDVDVSVVVGVLSSDRACKTLPSGTCICNLEVTVRTEGVATRSVPVAKFDPPRSVVSLSKGDRVVVAGEVVRRFFRAGGTTVSRTEVVASVIRRDTPAARRDIVKWLKTATAELVE